MGSLHQGPRLSTEVYCPTESLAVSVQLGRSVLECLDLEGASVFANAYSEILEHAACRFCVTVWIKKEFFGSMEALRGQWMAVSSETFVGTQSFDRKMFHVEHYLRWLLVFLIGFSAKVVKIGKIDHNLAELGSNICFFDKSGSKKWFAVDFAFF